MAREWVNLFVAPGGASPAAGYFEQLATVSVGNKTLRLYESDRSGQVLISQGGLVTYGDAEVYLQIRFSNGTARYLSAPLHTQIDVNNVASFDLAVIFLTGNPGSQYRALVNAHCLYEIL